MPLSRSNVCPSMRPDDRLKTAVGVCLSPLCPPVWLSSCLLLVADLSLAFVFASLRVLVVMRLPVIEFAQIASPSFNESAIAVVLDRFRAAVPHGVNVFSLVFRLIRFSLLLLLLFWPAFVVVRFCLFHHGIFRNCAIYRALRPVSLSLYHQLQYVLPSPGRNFRGTYGGRCGREWR